MGTPDLVFKLATVLLNAESEPVRHGLAVAGFLRV